VSLQRAWTAGVLALAVTSAGCPKTAVDCTPPPQPLVVSDAGCPSFSTVYTNVFMPVCGQCHRPGGQEAKTPLQTYQQIYGQGGMEANEIFTQVFESCLMPPSNAAPPLDAAGRQMLLDWIACGAPNDSPAVDAGAGN
jgi:hypothetical protein